MKAERMDTELFNDIGIKGKPWSAVFDILWTRWSTDERMIKDRRELELLLYHIVGELSELENSKKNKEPKNAS